MVIREQEDNVFLDNHKKLDTLAKNSGLKSKGRSVVADDRYQILITYISDKMALVSMSDKHGYQPGSIQIPDNIRDQIFDTLKFKLEHEVTMGSKVQKYICSCLHDVNFN